MHDLADILQVHPTTLVVGPGLIQAPTGALVVVEAATLLPTWPRALVFPLRAILEVLASTATLLAVVAVACPSLVLQLLQ
jgi:hypothetical protein